jgi:hypothetical protein
MRRSALFSKCRTWRYMLERIWNPALPFCVWVCMNPSTADETRDDPTIRRVIGFSARLSYGGFRLYNVLALRATHPSDLLKHANPRGPENSAQHIAAWCKEFSKEPAFIAWGDIHKKFTGDALAVIHALQIARCFGYTDKNHQPRHPLMLAYKTKFELTDPSKFLLRTD